VAVVGAPSLPRRLPWSRVPLALLNDELLELLVHLVHNRRLRVALEDEAALREGSDRSGPRLPGGCPW
jgi:hypothetical protein